MNDAREYGVEQAKHFQKKAEHNKRESLWCFRVIMGCTLAAPVLVGLGEGFWLGKVTPSVLSALAAFCTAWVQLRKPNELWSLYRHTQREIETQITRFDFQVGEFKSLDDEGGNRLLALNVSQISIDTSKRWSSKVPDVANVKFE
ncbi:DUF4231 domain-containing protein [Vibrio lentus]|uniref:DUF4231 domain-containing protein n=1 Tax=Vibrio TaxID=662 RepID=UPI000C8392D5|nr:MULTISPECIES: DUF4231 domain-containing protein [Vibrio]MCB5461756.1 DUF4231 domain-containing protein [Vibrio lentus]MCC4849323.1 DUF4231 domain-containing protein [Vibrio lentus]MCC5532139.1 DUF4231 domain-containing protein [Vibrio lentus]MCC5535426.1 DUF4231 domain-containing protein [Vibrio lentus]MCC5567944.1 DUF4231 domain-containing protein [Vibrio lentus]